MGHYVNFRRAAVLLFMFQESCFGIRLSVHDVDGFMKHVFEVQDESLQRFLQLFQRLCSSLACEFNYTTARAFVDGFIRFEGEILEAADGYTIYPNVYHELFNCGNIHPRVLVDELGHVVETISRANKVLLSPHALIGVQNNRGALDITFTH